jgi:hypothetical protein
MRPRPPSPPPLPLQVFGFTITNTVAEVLLERVTVHLVPSEAGCYNTLATIGVPRVREGVPGHVYVAFSRNPETGFRSLSFSAEVRFTSRECDPTANYEPVGDPTKERYPVDEVPVGPSDYVAPAHIPDFRAAWEAAGADAGVQEGFTLSHKSVADAVAAVVSTLQLTPQDGTGAVKPSASKHAVYLAGNFLGDTTVLARMMVTMEDAEGGGAQACILRIELRCKNRNVSELLLSTLG